MGIYLNGKKAYGLFQEDCALTYYVDKTDILDEIVPILEKGNNRTEKDGTHKRKGLKYICITRPRRFGKTAMANMIASYLGKGVDSSKEFDRLKASQYEWYEKHLNQHNVIRITFSEMPDGITSFEQYISRVTRLLLTDLKKAYPDAAIENDDAVWDALTKIYEYCDDETFVFILDEWDYIYHQKFVSQEDKDAFTRFLSILLKDQPYVEMAYMTGILPISKYSSGSELNMFFEFSMATMEKYSEYFGFTDGEVDVLYQRYIKLEDNPKVSRGDLRLWYNGYQTMSGRRLYNPRSVVGALEYNQIGSYWTNSGPYDEIYYYVKNDIANMREDIALMMSGTPVPANVQEYASVSMELTTKDEIFSAMVVYGFLSYADGYVSIPNKELMDKFAEMVRKRSDFGYINRLAEESGKMLAATKSGDTDTMVELLERVHNTESPLIRYSNEAELSKVITFVYLQAREYYDIRLEDHSGTGCVDYIFYPYKKENDGIIIELKVDDTADNAIRQIKDRRYAQNFDGKLGEEPKCTGRILAVGIAYNRKDENKRYEGKVEVLRARRDSEE